MPFQKSAKTVAAPPSPLMVSVAEAARLLGVSTDTVRLLCRKGQVRYKKLSRTMWLINFRSLREFANRLETAA